MKLLLCMQPNDEAASIAELLKAGFTKSIGLWRGKHYRCGALHVVITPARVWTLHVDRRGTAHLRDILAVVKGDFQTVECADPHHWWYQIGFYKELNGESLTPFLTYVMKEGRAQSRGGVRNEQGH